MKQTTRTCDICKEQDTKNASTDFSGAGWTEVKYTFGSSISAYNAINMTRDICPKCAEKMGLIKFNDNKALLRPKHDVKPEETTETNLMDMLRDFIVEVGSDEGWYPDN